MKTQYNFSSTLSVKKIAVASIAIWLTAGAVQSDGLNLGVASASIGVNDGLSANVSVGSGSSPAATASVNIGSQDSIDVSLGLGGTGSPGVGTPTTTSAALSQPTPGGQTAGARMDLLQLIGNTLVSSDGRTLAIITAARYAANGNVELDLQISAALGVPVDRTTIQLPTATPVRNAIRIQMNERQFVDFIA